MQAQSLWIKVSLSVFDMISVTLGGIVREVFRTVRPLFLFLFGGGGGQEVGDNKYQKMKNKNDKLICLAGICYLTFFFAHCYNIDLKKLLWSFIEKSSFFWKLQPKNTFKGSKPTKNLF